MSKAPKAVKSAALTTPSLLAFSRCIEPTDGFFYQKDSRDNNAALKPVQVSTRKLRGTMSNRQKAAVMKDAEKMNAEVIKSNPQQTEVCYLDRDCDTLVVKTGIKILQFDGSASNCNKKAFADKLKEIVNTYVNEISFDELANRYATNIANARWLWRNRIGARSIKVSVECVTDDDTQTLVFDSKKLSISQATSTNESVVVLASMISKALSGKLFLSLYVTAEADIGFAHQAFPSEEMNLDDDKKGKELFQIDGIAAFHSVKIGNAIRTIDNWYPSDNESPTPISIEPFGSVTNLGTAFRQPTNNSDFYTLFDAWVKDDVVPTIDNQHFVIAMLMRGGVFGESSK